MALRDDEIRRLLVSANPWWLAASAGTDPTAWTRTHRLLRSRAPYDLGYRTRILQDIADNPLSDALVVLTGPRRIGKSVALLDLVAALCAKPEIDPRQIIHLPCDTFQARDLRRALTLGAALTATIDHGRGARRVWLLDEISSVAGWTMSIKAARDQSTFGDDTVILTGSRWTAGEDVQGNLLAGRAGSGAHRRVRHLHPMTFRDFLTATRRGLPLPDRVDPWALQDPATRQALAPLLYLADDIDLAWQDYLTSGGFPRAVAEWRATGAVSNGYAQDLASWLRRDVGGDEQPESLPTILSVIEQRSSSPLNVRHSAESAGQTREVFDRRLARLIGSFAALWCPQRDDEGRAVPGSQAKLYLTDPVLAWLPHQLRTGMPAPDMTRLSEACVGIALARAIDAREPLRWIASDTIGFTRTRTGKEIDFSPIPVPTPAGPMWTTPIESKWVDDGWRAEARAIENKYHAGILATKSIMNFEHEVWAIPAPTLALLLE